MTVSVFMKETLKDVFYSQDKTISSKTSFFSQSSRLNQQAHCQLGGVLLG